MNGVMTDAVTARVGMVGGGQLARMTHRAAIDLGIDLHVLAASERDPAVLAGSSHTIGDPGELDALRALASANDVLTFDHERIPNAHLRALEDEGFMVAPPARAKLLAQDKYLARQVLGDAGYPVPPFALADEPQAIVAFGALHGWPLVAKAPSGGYDGRGVWTVSDPAGAAAALADAGGTLLLEPRLTLDAEIAVLVARTSSGQIACYPAVETVQEDAMCREILAPARISSFVRDEAEQLARGIAETIGATGILAVELFLTPDGLIVNELALRPHNSGHYTIEGATTSQFEQHLRAVLDLPLGETRLTAPAVATVNIIGSGAAGPMNERVRGALQIPGAHLHLYRKDDRPGRKLGHVTVCGSELDAARAAALQAAAMIEGRDA